MQVYINFQSLFLDNSNDFEDLRWESFDQYEEKRSGDLLLWLSFPSYFRDY